MKKYVFLMMVIGLSCSSAFGYVMYFNGDAGTTDWHTAANWQYDRVPNTGIEVRIGIYFTSSVTVDVTNQQAQTNGLQIGWDSWAVTSTLNLNGTSDLWCKNDGSVFQGQSYGIVNVNDDSIGRASIVNLNGTQLNLNTTRWFQFATSDWQVLGDSYITVNGGELVFTNGGTFSAYDGSLGYNPNFTGTIDVAGGKLKLDGDDQAAVNWHINNGNIIAYGDDSGYDLQVTYDGTNTWVEAVAVPEPATLALLGLGSLLTMRRRR